MRETKLERGEECKNWTVDQLVQQIEYCDYEIEAGSLKSNHAWLELKHRLKMIENIAQRSMNDE